MKISQNFDSGNIEVISADDNKNIRLNIRKDTNADHFQWFYFRLQDARGYPCKMTIENAHAASYPEGWEGYEVCASYDRSYWFRIPTKYDGKVLSFELTPDFNSVFFAYFAPYTYEQHLDLIHSAQMSDLCVVKNLGLTGLGKDIDLLEIGEPGIGKKNIWVIARQHPGESQASWFMEGFIERLLNYDDPVSRVLLEKAVFYVVPLVNPDGAVLGNLRCTASGINLNREWAKPDIEKSPEVFHIRNEMDETGVDLMLDIHADEGLPYNFVSSIEGIPGFDKRLSNLLSEFKNEWLKISPDFQDEHTYPKDKPKKGNLNICSKQIGHRYNCLSITIEMPFKDNKNLPDPTTGWSPERSYKFGESVLYPILAVVDDLR
ncbi:MAG: M14-type cytosolic carboxypeptidase [Bacteroidota bacterium]|nr:M14-type cytosolic carboxypeptidase [Bacteroidota bacterium]